MQDVQDDEEVLLLAQVDFLLRRQVQVDSLLSLEGRVLQVAF